MLRLLAIRDARLFLVGQTLSLFGDTALYLALGIWVKSLTGSNAAAGLIFFVLALPALVAPAAGLLVDRVRRRPLMIATDLLIGAAVLLLLFVHGREQLWLIYAVAALYGAAGVVFGSAQSALLTVMLPDELLGEGNAALQTVRETVRIVGPLSGAALYAAFGGGFVAMLDGATFGASALCLAGLSVVEPPPARGEQRFRTELVAGVQHILRTAALRQIVLTVAAALLVVGFSETVVFAVVGQGLRRPPSFLGVLSSVQGVGAIAGGLTAARALRRIGDARTIALGLALFALGDGLLVGQALAPVIAGFLNRGRGATLGGHRLRDGAAAAHLRAAAGARLLRGGHHGRHAADSLDSPGRRAVHPPRLPHPRRDPGGRRDRLRRLPVHPPHQGPGPGARDRGRLTPRVPLSARLSHGKRAGRPAGWRRRGP